MIENAEKLYNIDLSKSYIIGDSTVDIMTGKNAGLKTVLVKTGLAGLDNEYNPIPDIIVENLLEAVYKILKEGNVIGS